MLDWQIQYICNQIEATEPPTLFLTGKGNFRNDIAKRTPYKERNGVKPFHYYNLRAYIKGKYDYQLQDGLEADDLLAIEQTKRGGAACICSIDKDLGAVPGWNYKWEVGARPADNLHYIEPFGKIWLHGSNKKLKGEGVLFFLSQLLTGDPTDSIPGLPRCGPIKAYEALSTCKTYEEGLKIVFNLYKDKFGIKAKEEMLEQGRLLWMTRELDAEGNPVLWDFEIA